ncbi:hypothetical protein ZYGR_0W00360 [Zygosaccharomyces rouxii]|uniref:Sterol 3-beta-glucosyltransferase n=1 Tax=Zygosaccharomyces rouxii TaxID=4956 RepID=A0A1Q3A4K5_ZYGRO|nr:hypothetical protein ZYGR_0W00360 [Zygosaccharomyces rouxii]
MTPVMLGDWTLRKPDTPKSIVELLTTASVVAGMGEQQQAKDVADELDGGDIDSDEFVDAKSEVSVEPASGGKVEDVDVSRVDDGKYSNEQAGFDGTTTARSLGFDLSVEPVEKTRDYINSLDLTRRRTMIQKQVDHFKLSEDEKFVGDFPAFLLKDVLIQGQIYLTSMHLLFFAYLPTNSDEVQLSGNLNVHSRIRGSTRYWAVLRNQSLSLYSSPTETYFPELEIDLKTTASITAIQSKTTGKPTNSFKIETKKRNFTFSADSEFAAKSWTNSLRKQHFAAQNANQNSVSLKIPLVNTMEVIDEPVLEYASTVRVKAVESSVSGVHVEFVFVFLDNSSTTLKRHIDAQLELLEQSGIPALGRVFSSGQNVVSDSTDASIRGKNPNDSNEGADVSSPKRASHLHHILPHFPRRQGSSSSEEKSSGLSSLKPKFGSNSRGNGDTDASSSSSHLLIPVKSVVQKPKSFVQDFNTKAHVTTGNGSWSSSSDVDENGTESKKGHQHRYFRHGLWNNKPIHYRNTSVPFGDEDPYLASPDENKAANEKFREHFHLDSNANLIGAYFAHLSRNIPVYGKVYLSEDMMGFRSLLPGTHTKMNLPLVDVEACYKEQAFSFGYEDLILVVRGNNELCFAFSSTEARDDAESIIRKRMEVLKLRRREIMNPTTNILEVDPHFAKMKLVEDKINAGGIDAPLVVDKNPYYATTIKPHGKKLKIGLLTIGSRGDVQPYIAFGKGLQKEGHDVVIITHGEFREFVESRGIAFDEVAGNPAELMSLMVEHESLNVGLLKNAATNFRSWIAELLQTAWKACVRSEIDVLVESPSAMAGIHIAEALQIPYLRAFTMPWTRTRAYPHAFIVPDQPKGGNYNYMTHVLWENIFWKGISGQVNKWRVETLDLPKTNLELMQQSKVPFLYNVSPSIFPPAVDFCEWVKVTGYWFLDEGQSYTPPPDLETFIAKARKLNKKLVYIGFGSIVVSDAKEMTKAITEAVLEADVYCILNKGWSDRLSSKSDKKEIEEPLPESIYNSGSIPHDWLFPQMDAAVHHGGSGTTGASLKAGCPTIVKPFFGDQYFYATRVQDIGAGIALKKLTGKSLARALKEATHNEKMKMKAQEIKEKISLEDGVKTAINCLYTELEYAKSLVVVKAEQRNSPRSRLLELPSFAAPKLPDLNLEKTFAFL